MEATEEAVLNAIFCSEGMDGKEGRSAPSLDHAFMKESLRGKKK